MFRVSSRSGFLLLRLPLSLLFLFFLPVFPCFSFFSLPLLNLLDCAVLRVSGDAPHSTRSCGIKIRAGTQLRAPALRLIELLGREDPRHCF
jgi:hypothetical protein